MNAKVAWLGLSMLAATMSFLPAAEASWDCGTVSGFNWKPCNAVGGCGNVVPNTTPQGKETSTGVAACTGDCSDVGFGLAGLAYYNDTPRC